MIADEFKKRNKIFPPQTRGENPSYQMNAVMTPDKNDATVLLRLPSELKHALLREAFVHGRRITAEINMRLVDSLRANSFPPTIPRNASVTGDSQSDVELEEKLLAMFRALPVEKRLALLALLK